MELQTDEGIKAAALDLAIKAFCPKLISAPHVVEAAKVFEAYLRNNAGNTLDEFVAREIDVVATTDPTATTHAVSQETL